MLSGCSAVGSALDWGSKGRRFNPCHSDQISRVSDLSETLIYLEKQHSNSMGTKSPKRNEKVHNNPLVFLRFDCCQHPLFFRFFPQVGVNSAGYV